MSDYRYKMVNGELVELTPQEIKELEQRDAEFAKNPPLDPAALAPQQEPADAKRRTK